MTKTEDKRRQEAIKKALEERERWEKFQLVMGFCDYLVNHNEVAVCRRLSQKELKDLDLDGTTGEAYAYESLRFNDVEKIVRRYFQLPTKEQSEREADKAVRDIQARARKDHEEERIREALPSVPVD